MIGKTTIILISGKAGVGKTFLATTLYDIFSYRGYNTEIQHFASTLKWIAQEYLWWDGAKDEKGRRLLQRLGDIGREYDKDVWIKNLVEMRLLTSKKYPQDVVIVDDWRFPNEYNYLKKNCNYSLYTINLVAPDREILHGNDSKHISEISLPEGDSIKDYYNFVINNCESERVDLLIPAKQIADSILKREDTYK